jgi:hypothetical protein
MAHPRRRGGGRRGRVTVLPVPVPEPSRGVGAGAPQGCPTSRHPRRADHRAYDLAHIVGVSKIAYVLATPRCLDWRRDLQQTSRNHYGSWAGSSAITFGRNGKPT